VAVVVLRDFYFLRRMQRLRAVLLSTTGRLSGFALTILTRHALSAMGWTNAHAILCAHGMTFLACGPSAPVSLENAPLFPI
jgi:hypothetical protein